MRGGIWLFAFGCMAGGIAQADEQSEALRACRQMTGAEMLRSRPECLTLLQREAAAVQQNAAVQNAPVQQNTIMQQNAAPAAPLPDLPSADGAAQAQPAQEKTAQEEPAQQKILPPVARVLDAEWPRPMQVKRISAYRQNYLLATYTSSPNNAPTSPNPLNVVTPDYQPQADELKFQISIKARISELAGGMVWFGYTQQSYWQFFNSDNSRPFRESNYAPELIYSYQLNKESGFGLLPRVLNVGLEHQSNGQSLPRSRSWNRIYAQGGWENDDFFGNTLVVMPRVWWRVHENAQDDDNPDITHYLGYGDLNLRYLVHRSDNKDTIFDMLIRRRSAQFDLSVPVVGSSDLSFHLQYFTGYGESLIDYNQKHNTTGIGFSAMF